MQVFYNIVVFITVALLIITVMGIILTIKYRKDKKMMLHIKSFYKNLLWIHGINLLLILLFEKIYEEITPNYIIAGLSYCCYLVLFHGILDEMSLKFKVIFVAVVIFLAINFLTERILQWNFLDFYTVFS